MEEPKAAAGYVPEFCKLADLAAERVGGKALYANDEFFAPKENLLKPGRGIFIPEKFTSRGKWMDGWESRRRRAPGHDWCVIRLGMPGVIRGLDVDTNHFLGNFPERCSLEACAVSKEPKVSHWKLESTAWRELLPESGLKGGSRNFFTIHDASRWTHVRFHIYPDGGVARLRVHGEVRPDWDALRKRGKPVDLAAIENGGLVEACNDMFFGPKDNLIMPGRALNMGDGWETRRKRVPGHDWIMVQFGTPGRVARVEVDTSHFKGNFPDRCSIDAFPAEGGEALEILPQTKLRAHFRHLFAKEILHKERAFARLRLNIYPDGGVARLRVWGTPLAWT
ncbi:MAG: allantoicase [Elusimicrobia bacterium]|nr:allantoicase [Elusimicrobiota bacterium]